MTTGGDVVEELDPFSPQYWQDIHGVVGALRERWPVVPSTLGGVEVLRWDDGEPLLHDPRLHQALVGMLARQGIDDGPLHAWWQLLMNNHDAPTHTRLRSLVGRAFTPRRVEQIRPRIRALADQLVAETIAQCEESGEVEVLTGLCNRLPLVVLCEMLGIEPEHEEVVEQWTTLVGMAFSPIIPPELRVDIERSVVEFDAYADELIDRRRAEPTDDLLGALVSAEESGDRLSRSELRALIINLLFAGHDTTRSLLSIGLWLLATHPDQYQLLRENPALITGAVEEICRFETPISGIPRISDQEIEIAGTRIPAGTIVTISPPGAHRDPRRFEHPDRFDVTRTDVRHLTFGHGVHHCVGAAVGRAEVREALAAVVEACGELHSGMDLPAWVPYAAARRFTSLPLTMQR
jgi:cytochrome P450